MVPTLTSGQARDGRQIDPDWAWAPYEPSPEQPWNLERAAHLWRRAAWGGTWPQLQQAVREGPATSVERLLRGESGQEEFYRVASQTAQAVAATGDGHDLAAWWLYTMLHSPHPLLERITFFWHGHFATSAAKVSDARLMLAQNDALRRHALGPFGPLLYELARDPAMLLWLDSASNRKTKPNENFAREVMELFCLGLGNYSERDIQEAARAFTGWEVRHGKFVYSPHHHDAGTKSVLGRSGPLTGDDVLDILLDQPATAQFLVGKVYRYLVSDTLPDDQLLRPLAEQFRRHDYSTAWLVATMLRSNLFYSELSLYRRIKSPVELAVGLLRGLEATTNCTALAADLQPAGQVPFYPPSVKGWDAGRAWITTSTMLARINLVWNLVSGTHPRYGRKVALDELAQRHGMTDSDAAAAWLGELLLGRPLDEGIQQHLLTVGEQATQPHLRLARVVQGLAARAEFHLA
jgi:uncharacterized protein (DUF1800 family)